MDWQSSFLTLPSVHTKSDKWLLSSRWEKAQRMKIRSLYVLRTEVPVFDCWNRKHCQILLENSIVTLANTTFAQGENGRGHLSATSSSKKLEMKDAKEITVLRGLLQYCLVLSFFFFSSFWFCSVWFLDVTEADAILDLLSIPCKNIFVLIQHQTFQLERT